MFAQSLEQFSEHFLGPGSSSKIQDLALVRDTKVPLNSGKRWHRTDVKLEDSLRTVVFTVVGVSGHLSDFFHPYQ